MTIQTLRFDGTMTLTHSASRLVLPNGSDLVTAPGDRAWFWLENPKDFASTLAILINYQTADGKVIWPSHYYGA